MAGLYIHVPYCTSKCAYCDFYSGPLRIFEPESYFNAVGRELAARRGEIGEMKQYISEAERRDVSTRRSSARFLISEAEKKLLR